MNLDPVLKGILIGAGIGLLGTLLNVLVQLKAQRSDERKHYRELMVKTAFEQWKIIRGDGTGHSPELEVFIISMVKITELAVDKRVTSETVIPKLKEIDLMLARIMTYKNTETPLHKLPWFGK